MKPPARKRKGPPKYSESALGLSDVEDDMDDQEVEKATSHERKLAKFMESDEEVFEEGDDGRLGEGREKESCPVSEPDAVSEAPLATIKEVTKKPDEEEAVDLVENTYSEAAKAVMVRVVAGGVPCVCVLGCGEGCYNRRERRECSPSQGHGVCSNMVLQLQRHKPALVEVEEGEDGRLVAAVSLPSHTFLGEWTGEVVTREELEERMRRQEGVKVVKAHVLGEGLVIDSSDRESSCRLASHSCSPCAVAEVWEVSGQLRLALFTTRPVTQGELVTLDLGSQLEVLDTRKICRCEATNCRQLLGASVVTQQPTLCCSSSCKTPLPPGKTMLHPSLALPSCLSCRGTFLAVARELQEDRETCRCCGTSQPDPAGCSQCPAVFCSPCLGQMLGLDYVMLARQPSWCCLLCDSRPLRNLRLLLLKESGHNIHHPRGAGKRRGRGRGLPSPRPGAVRVRPPGHLLASRGITRPLYPGGRGTPRPPGGRGAPRPRHPGGRGTPRPSYPGGQVITRTSTQGLLRPRQTPPGPRIHQPQPRALVFSPNPSLTPPTTYQDDSASAQASMLPHFNRSYKVSPYTALLTDREEICLSSDNEGEEMEPVRLPVLPACITISRIDEVSVVQELAGARKLLSEAISRVEQWGKGEETKLANKEDMGTTVRTVKQMMQVVERKLGI